MAAEIISVHAADGTSLAVGSYLGARSGPVTLVVHGIASHMGWYHGLAEALQAEGVTVYMPDRRGVALSGGTPGHTNRWKTLEDDLSRIASEIEYRHPGRPIHAIGISLGGVITLASSILHPGLFRSQILLSPALAASTTFPLLRRIEVFWRALSAPRKLYDLPFGVKDLTDNLDWQTALFEESKRNQVSARFLLERCRCSASCASTSNTSIRRFWLCLESGIWLSTTKHLLIFSPEPDPLVSESRSSRPCRTSSPLPYRNKN